MSDFLKIVPKNHKDPAALHRVRLPTEPPTLLCVAHGTPRVVIDRALAHEGKLPATRAIREDLLKVWQDQITMREHEIEGIRRRIDSDEEKDRREYLESFIIHHDKMITDARRLVAEYSSVHPPAAVRH